MKTIMIVEDDLSIRDALSELLSSEGYVVVRAEHGEQALNHLKRLPKVDLILLDLSMPVMDGKTFLREIGVQFPEYKDLPIIIMIAAGPGEIPQTHSRDRILRKPLDVEEIISKIEKIIESVA
jgi:two-component system cell cycle sensor histidine kinase/response regulator CckA